MGFTTENSFSSLFKYFVLVNILLQMPMHSVSQTTSYYQFTNDFQFNRAFKTKWASQIDGGYTTINNYGNKNPFSDFSQFVGRFWLHYYYNSRWKLSGFIANLRNFEVYDLDQYKYMEWRISPQAVYYIRKRIYTLSTRMSFDVRLMQNEAREYNDYYRYRQQVKFLKAFNSKFIRQGVWYGIASDEIIFKVFGSTEKISVDRNFLILGVGYSITDDTQIECSYQNEYLPRHGADLIYHTINVGFTFNNFLANVKNRIKSFNTNTKPDEE
jgi:hypothetical protein